MTLSQLSGKKLVIVASTGGHLQQAVEWSKRLHLHRDSLFVTFRNPQSESLLASRPALYVRYVPPRGGLAIFGAFRELVGEIDWKEYYGVLSTGAGFALAAVPFAKLHRKPFYYVESVSRFAGPSLTGRIMSILPVDRYTQHNSYAGKKWKLAPSLMDAYIPALRNAPCAAGSGLRIFVTLGTIKPYRFDRMIDAILPSLTLGDQIVWQTGESWREGLPGEAHREMSGSEFRRNCAEADVVITHAGVGTLMLLLDLGKVPIVYARSSAMNEHVDNHQQQVASDLVRRGLALHGPEMLTRDQLIEAGSTTVVRAEGNDKKSVGPDGD